jgi:hypothetical protein
MPIACPAVTKEKRNRCAAEEALAAFLSGEPAEGLPAGPGPWGARERTDTNRLFG